MLNKDLWERLAGVLDFVEVKWQLIKGHSGIPANERCDVIATSFADGKKAALFNGPSVKYEIDTKVKVKTGLANTKHQTPKTSKGKPFSYVSSLNGDVKVHSSWKECEARVKGKSKALFKKSFSATDEKAIIASWKGAYHS